MGRPLRRHEPGQYYLVTTRCHQSRFLLRPDQKLNGAVVEWLTRAQQRFPNIAILAVCVMSNHLHLVIRDERGELAAWASYFLGHLARAINRIRGRSGCVYERRFSAEPILDDGALLDRIVYTVTNPVAAGLCKRADTWPGVVLFATDQPKEIAVTWVDRDNSRFARIRARARGEAPPSDHEFLLHGKLIIDPAPFTNDLNDKSGSTGAAIEAREQHLAEERRHSRRKTLTRKQVLSQSWRSAPSQPNRSPRPICHSSDPVLRREFIKGFRDFVGLFREASERLRRGDPSVAFPLWCYPPGLPLIRPRTDHVAGAG